MIGGAVEGLGREAAERFADRADDLAQTAEQARRPGDGLEDADRSSARAGGDRGEVLAGRRAEPLVVDQREVLGRRRAAEHGFAGHTVDLDGEAADVGLAVRRDVEAAVGQPQPHLVRRLGREDAVPRVLGQAVGHGQGAAQGEALPAVQGATGAEPVGLAPLHGGELLGLPGVAALFVRGDDFTPRGAGFGHGG